MVRTSLDTETSVRRNEATPPSATIRAAAASPPSTSMSASSPRVPREANAPAAARPIPLAAPVTMATLPSNSGMPRRPRSAPVRFGGVIGLPCELLVGELAQRRRHDLDRHHSVVTLVVEHGDEPSQLQLALARQRPTMQHLVGQILGLEGRGV